MLAELIRDGRLVVRIDAEGAHELPTLSGGENADHQGECVDPVLLQPADDLSAIAVWPDLDDHLDVVLILRHTRPR